MELSNFTLWPKVIHFPVKPENMSFPSNFLLSPLLSALVNATTVNNLAFYKYILKSLILKMMKKLGWQVLTQRLP